MNKMNSKLNEIIKFPKYKLILPVSKKEKFFRPFTVREESTILLAKQTEDPVLILKNLIDVMSLCFGEDISKYEVADFEYAFLKLREKSIGEIEKFTITCPETKENIELEVNLINDIIVFNKDTKNKIELDEGVFIEFSSPTINDIITNPDYSKNFESNIKFISNCIKKIQNKKQIIDGNDISVSELQQFIENLTTKQFKKITDYFDAASKLFIQLKYKTSDGIERNKNLTGTFNIINFFFDHISVQTFYQLMFQMKYFHNYSIEEYYEMLPWQRQVLMYMIIEELEKEKQSNNSAISI